MKKGLVAIALTVVSAGAATLAWRASVAPKPSQVALRPMVEFLAADAREGRALGSPGEADSATFIADTFSKLGLTPHLQPFSVVVDGGALSSSGNVWAMLDVGARETIVLGAHYDHLGRGPRFSREPFVEAIHNGADDNASGVAVLLRLADRYATGARSSKVNLVFIAFSGEEEGLHGSRHFLESNPVDFSSVLCFVNFDMVGRRDALTPMLTLEGAIESPVWKEVLGELEPRGFTLRTSEPITPRSSDHHSFAQRGLPVLSITTGISDDYHTPSDDLGRLDFEGMEAVVELTLNLLDGVAKRRAAFTQRVGPAAAPAATPLP